MNRTAAREGDRIPEAPGGAVARAFTLLENLSATGPTSLEDISRSTGLAKPTAHRLLLTLQGLGYARRDERDRYTLTMRMFMTGSRALDRLDLLSLARPVAESLAAETGETVHMGAREGEEAVYILKIESRYTIRMYSRVGRRMPLYCSALGKVLLAGMAACERDALIGGLKLVAYTPKTIVGIGALESELSDVEREGCAFDREEHEEGIRCVAAPIRGYDGTVLAAISVSWPSFRYARTDEAREVGNVKTAAARISALLGYASTEEGI
jgi:IclR family KDG regulon transcriptional repressor